MRPSRPGKFAFFPTTRALKSVYYMGLRIGEPRLMKLALRFLFLTACAPTVAAQDGKGVYQAPDREPTPAEVQILEYMNRFRANPQAEFDLLPRKDGVDWKMFRDEMMALTPAPPLVFNLELLDAARKHSHYMNLNGQFHDEDPVKAGFTGANGGDRMKKAGYGALAWGENIYANIESPWYSHQGFVVDWGAGPGGMQPSRGHRKNLMNPAFREVGPGVAPSGKGMSVTHNLGTRNIRMVGGVIYRDANGNRFYDPGEGVGSVALTSSDGASGVSWKSGAYTLELKSIDEVTITATINGLKFSRTCPAGLENVKFDVIVPDPAALKRLDKAIDETGKIKDAASPAYFKSAVAVQVCSHGLSLDDARRQRIEELTRDVAAPLEAAQRAVLEALKETEAAGLKKVLEELRKPYKGTEADLWFQDAEAIAKLRRGMVAFQKLSATASEKDKRLFVASLEQEGSRLKTTAFKQELEALISKAKSL
jgi:hypothetical protein